MTTVRVGYRHKKQVGHRAWIFGIGMVACLIGGLGYEAHPALSFTIIVVGALICWASLTCPSTLSRYF